MRYTPLHPELAGLIAAIRDNPDDDAPRLVCADWYDDNGEPERAEFVRVQLERARLPWGDARQAALMSRELRLLRRFAPAWTTGVHPLLKKCRFPRGFPEHVHLHLSHFLHHRRQLLSVAPIRDVSLTGVSGVPHDSARRVAECREWSAVERLAIHAQGLQNVIDGSVLTLLESPHLTRLRALDVAPVAFTSDDRRRFERLAVLGRFEELALPDVDSQPRTPGCWFAEGLGTGSRWRNIRALTLRFAYPDEGMARILALPFAARLEALTVELRYNPQAVFALVARRLPPGLRHLRLVSSYPHELQPTEADIAALAALPLESFRFESGSLPAEALRRLLSRESRWNLRRLSLAGVSGEHLHAIAEHAAAGLESLTVGVTRESTIDMPPGHIRSGMRRLELSGITFGRDNEPVSVRELRLRCSPGVEMPTPERFPDLVRLNVRVGRNVGREGLIESSTRFPLLGRFDYCAHDITPAEHAALDGSDDRLWLSVTDTAERTTSRDAYESRTAERTPPLDDE